MEEMVTDVVQNNNDEDLKITIGKNIAEYRKIAGLSQIEFAEKLNYSDKAISKWERGESLPDVIVLKQIADFFGITLNDLAGYNQKKGKFMPSLKKLLQNKILVMLLSVGLVWLIATIVFVILKLVKVFSSEAWLAFIYALPVSFIVCIVFSAVFFKHQKFMQILLGVFESLLIWTLSLSVCLSINFTDIWLILIIAIPMQVLIILWNIFKKRKV